MTEPNTVIKIKATNLTLTGAIEGYTREKLALLRKFLMHYAHESGELIFDVEVEKTTEHHRQGDVFRAEINFTAGSINFRAEATESDLYAAIDRAKDEMERELLRGKNKHIRLVRQGGAQLKKIIRGLYRR